MPFYRVSEGEMVALFLAERLLQQYRGTPFSGLLAGLFDKIAMALPEEVTVSLDHLRGAYSFRTSALEPGDVEQLRQLHRAVPEQRPLELLYWSAARDATAWRKVDPYHLASIDGDW